jgi:ParB-like chromosome segregation protein Spo0J
MKLSITVPMMKFDKKLGTEKSPVVPTVIEYEVHPAAELFPLLEDDELQKLADDIREHGQIHPILIDAQRRIVDGRNRFLACEKAGVEPEVAYVDLPRYDADYKSEIIAFVASANLKRRHLTTSQRAMIAAKLAPMFEEAAKQRMLRGTPSASWREGDEGGKAAEKAAEATGVGTRSVERAQQVLREGSPEQVQAI